MSGTGSRDALAGGRRNLAAGFVPAVIVALPALLIGAVLLAAWPGYLSHDSAYQFWQARTGAFGDVSPPLWPLLWRLSLLAGLPASSGPLLLIGLLFSAGFGGIALAAWRTGQARLAWAVAWLGPSCPVLVVLLPHLWTDVLLAATGLATMAVLQLAPPRQLAGAFLLGLLLLAMTGLRHNAVLAVLPLAACWLWRWWPTAPTAARLGGLVAMVALLLGANALLRDVLVEQRHDTWAVTPLHDLQAVSIATGTVRIPASLAGPGLTVDELRAAFHPHSATTLFSGTRSGVHDPVSAPLQPHQRDQLLDAWLALPTEPAYWQHRGQLFGAMLGPQTGALRGLAESPTLNRYADNPPMERAFPLLHDGYRKLADLLHGVGLYSAGALLLLAMLGAPWLHARRADPLRATGLWLLASALAYAVPYLLIAPSAELRYLLWPAVAAWMAVLITVFGRARDGR